MNAAKAYSERMSDQAEAAQTFESLISRFPEGDLVPETLYNLYKINKEGNNAKAEAYRQRLLEKYPESEFSRILSDPAYYEKKMANLKMNESLYEGAYNAYSSEKFNDAISICNDALKKFPQNPLAPKFMLLRSYSVARISDEKSFKDELNNLVKTWPGTAESRKAEELIAYLNQKLPELKVMEDKKVAAELYVADTTGTYKFVLIISDPTFNINQATFDVISYNIDNFTNKNYRAEGTLVDNKYIMITVSGFQDYSQAFNYYTLFKPENQVRNPTGSKMMTFIISDSNLKVMNNDKNPGRYLIFFEEKYLK